MKNTIGDNVTLTLFGESHGSYIGAVLDGVAPGIKIDKEFIDAQLAKRRPQGNIETARVELDEYEIVSGVFNDYTTGAPLTIIIPNKNVKSKDYESVKSVARPSHADYTAYVKYHGYSDYRGGGHFSGRNTAPIVAMGAILLKALEKKNIYIGTHIKQCGNVIDDDFSIDCHEVKDISSKRFPTILNIEENITSEIEKAKMSTDSIGGILQTAIVGLPAGLGDPWFTSVEGKISNALFSIGGIKGVEFGLGFDFANYNGSTCNDEFYIFKNKILTKTNNNGGINGGITNGMPVVFNTAIKPTPSIAKVQNTVDFKNLENVQLSIEGRHDPAIIRRIAVVIDSMMAIIVCDLLASRYGNDYLDFED